MRLILIISLLINFYSLKPVRPPFTLHILNGSPDWQQQTTASNVQSVTRCSRNTWKKHSIYTKMDSISSSSPSLQKRWGVWKRSKSSVRCWWNLILLLSKIYIVDACFLYSLIYSTAFFVRRLAPSALSLIDSEVVSTFRLIFFGSGMVGSSASPPAKYRTLFISSAEVLMMITHLRASKTIRPTILIYMIQVHFAGESLKEDGRGLKATKALHISFYEQTREWEKHTIEPALSALIRYKRLNLHHK